MRTFVLCLAEFKKACTQKNGALAGRLEPSLWPELFLFFVVVVVVVVVVVKIHAHFTHGCGNPLTIQRPTCTLSAQGKGGTKVERTFIYFVFVTISGPSTFVVVVGQRNVLIQHG